MKVYKSLHDFECGSIVNPIKIYKDDKLLSIGEEMYHNGIRVFAVGSYYFRKHMIVL